jgi:hypothetical protein
MTAIRGTAARTEASPLAMVRAVLRRRRAGMLRLKATW